ncbi:MAG: hypothetical protein OXF63_05330 [Anaerolineaceae bacterium]|nr:hypothetical protein [Anaerolineaceae bacterium]
MKSALGLRQLALLLLLCYLAIALAAAWWATGARGGLIDREDNPRQAMRTATSEEAPGRS